MFVLNEVGALEHSIRLQFEFKLRSHPLDQLLQSASELAANAKAHVLKAHFVFVTVSHAQDTPLVSYIKAQYGDPIFEFY